MSDGFQRVLAHIRSIAGTQAEKGRLFERLMKAYFEKDPLYRERFTQVRLWSEWAATRRDFDRGDTGIDLVAEERDGGCCAIQCKCYAPGTRISKADLDSFIAASAREPFTARIVVDTGDEWGPNAVKTITGLKPACSVLRFGDLASRPFDWPDLVREAPEDLALCETRHVDGQNHALERKSRIEWLKGSTEGACRILSNARCLSEGIDVPALDAVIFMTERRSVVDIVQAVGRAMRKAEGKTYGYIVLPVAVPAGRDPALVLDSGREFDVVWSVLRALRSHDDRLDAEINKIDLNDNPTDRVIFHRDGTDGDALPDAPALPFPPLDLPPGAIYAKIVEECGDRKYWDELHANELVLLAYYIAAIHIEEAFRGRVGDGSAHEPFGGIVLTDTFNLHTERAGFPRDWLPDNSERAERQQKLPIQVIVGNPPWSTGQKSSADDNPNVDYPELERRVAETYAARSTATLKNSLYDALLHPRHRPYARPPLPRVRTVLPPMGLPSTTGAPSARPNFWRIPSSASTTSPTEHWPPFVRTIVHWPSPRTRSSITSTAFFTRPHIARSSPTTSRRNCRASRWPATSMPSPKPDAGWRSCISATRVARSIRSRPSSCCRASRNPSTSAWVRRRCGSRTRTERFSRSTTTSALRVSRPRRTCIKSTGERPLEWFIDRYRITRNKDSGIVNDPNGWFDDPRDLVAAFRRIVHVSVATVTIVASLPCPLPEPKGELSGERA